MIARLREIAHRHRLELGILLAGAALRLALLDLRSLSFDEAKSLLVSAAPLAGIADRVRALEGIPPLYFILARFPGLGIWGCLGGLRALSSACGIATLALFMVLARRLFPKQAPWALFLACFSSYWIHLAQDGRAYALFLLLAVAQALLAFELLNGWSKRLLAGYALIGIGGLYTHNHFQFLWFGHFLYIALRGKLDRRRLASWLVVHAAMAAAYAPWVPSLLVQMGYAHTSILQRPLTASYAAQIAGVMLVDVPYLDLVLPRALGALGLAALLAAAASGASQWRLLRFSGDARALEFCLFHLLVPLLALRVVELAARPITQTRYLAFVSPFFYLLLARLSAAAPARLGQAWRWGLASVMVAGSAAYFATGFWLDPHLAALSRTVRASADRRMVLIHLSPVDYLSLRDYYLPERPHFMACTEHWPFTWDGVPGYPSQVTAGVLADFKDCVAIDPERRLSAHRVVRLPCARLRDYACPR